MESSPIASSRKSLIVFGFMILMLESVPFATKASAQSWPSSVTLTCIYSDDSQIGRTDLDVIGGTFSDNFGPRLRPRGRDQSSAEAWIGERQRMAMTRVSGNVSCAISGGDSAIHIFCRQVGPLTAHLPQPERDDAKSPPTGYAWSILIDPSDMAPLSDEEYPTLSGEPGPTVGPVIEQREYADVPGYVDSAELDRTCTSEAVAVGIARGPRQCKGRRVRMFLSRQCSLHGDLQSLRSLALRQ